MGKGGEINWESSVDTYTLPCVKQLVGICREHRDLSSVLCDDPEGWGVGGCLPRWGRSVLTELSHTAVQYKSILCCKATVFQFFFLILNYLVGSPWKFYIHHSMLLDADKEQQQQQSVFK